MKRSLLAVLVLAGAKAHAIGISTSTTYGSSLRSQSVQVDGEIGSSRNETSMFGWALNYDYDESIIPNPGYDDIIDRSYNYGAGMAWIGGSSNWSLDLFLEYSRTPEESLVVRGGRMSLSYHLDIDRPGDISEFYFWNFRLIAGNANYVQSYNGTAPRNATKVRPISGSNELRQEILGLNILWKPLRRLRFEVEADVFTYNHDPGRFAQDLDTPLAVQTGEIGFLGTVGGLPKEAYAAGVVWEVTDHWRASLHERYSFIAAADGTASGTKVSLSYQFAKYWKVSLGGERLEAEGFMDTLGVMGVAFGD